MTHSRLKPSKRRDHILNVAVDVAKSKGFQNITREMIAVAADVSPALINTYFGTMTILKFKIMTRAVSRWMPEIVAVGLAIKDPIAMKASKELKRAAAKFITQ